MVSELNMDKAAWGLSQGEQVTLRSLSTTPFPIHKATDAASADPDDPYAIGTGETADANIIIVRNPGTAFVDLFHYFGPDQTTPAVTTALKVKGYGFFKADTQLITGVLQAPDRIDTAFDELHHRSLLFDVLAGQELKGYWLPLLHPTTGVHEQDFGTALDIIKDSTTDFSDGLGAGRKFAIQHGQESLALWGCSHFMVQVSQAVADSGGTVTGGILMGIGRN